MTVAAAERIPTAGIVQLAAGVVLVGGSWPITRYALLQGAAPSWFALGRAGFSALVAGLALALARRLRWPGRRDMPALLAVGTLQLAGFFAFAHAAVAWVPAGRTAVLANCTIVFTVPLSLLVLREAISARRWAATLLAGAGIVVLMGPWAIDWAAPHVLLGHAFLIGAALCWAVAMLVVRGWPPRMTMLELLPWSFGLATILLSPMALAHAPGEWNGTSITCVLVVGLIIAPAATWCVMQATVLLPIVVASVGFLAGPALGVVLGTLFLQEALGPDMVVGAALILAGAALAATGGRRR